PFGEPPDRRRSRCIARRHSMNTTTAGRVPVHASESAAARTKKRYLILAMLFIVTTINYADRATLSIAGPALSKELGIDAVTMGYVFSAFGWSYVIAQLPG